MKKRTSFLVLAIAGLISFCISAPVFGQVYAPSGAVGTSASLSTANVGIGINLPTNQLHVQQNAISSTAEYPFLLSVSDAAMYDFFSIGNNSTTNSIFVPKLWGHRETGYSNESISIIGSTTSGNDVGSVPIMIFDSRIYTALSGSTETVPSPSPIGTRPLFDWASAGNSKMRMLSNGYLGIGTTSPGYLLDVDGAGHFSSDVITSSMVNVATTGQNQIILNSSSDYGTIQNDGSNVWSLGYKSSYTTTLGTHVLSWNTSGNVGIGTTGPLSKLDVSGGMAIGSYAGSNAAPTNGLIVSGLVGIGTSSPMPFGSSYPGFTLGKSAGFMSYYNGSGDYLVDNLYFDNTNWKYYANGAGTYLFQYAGNIGIVNASSGTAGNTATTTQRYIVMNDGTIGLGGSQTLNSTTGSAMLIEPGGNVGIGTTSPGANLEIVGSSGNSILNLRDHTDTLRFFVGSSGTTMIGNNALYGTDGVGALEVDQYSESLYACYLRSNAGGGRGLRIKGGYYSDTVPLLQIEANNASGGGYNTVGNERMVVLANGAVGIGTNMQNNPNNYLLAVNGTVGVKGAVIVENTSTTWPDYVFEKDYKIMSLSDLENYVSKEKHLPGVQSVDEIKKHGDDLVKNEAAILKNLEELSLHLIELQKENEALKARIAALESK